MDIPAEFTDLIERYLRSVLDSPAEHKGWKIPETTLVYPWIVRLLPGDALYLLDPQPARLHPGQPPHRRPDATFGIAYPPTDDERLRRAISWKYQYDLVQATPRPAHWLEVRFEDFVLKQEETLARLEDFLGIKLGPHPGPALKRWGAGSMTVA